MAVARRRRAERADGCEPQAILIYGLVATAFLWPALSVPDGVPSPSAGLYNHAPWQGLEGAPDPAFGNPALTDVTYQIQPWLLLLKSQLRSGELPLWNPYSFLGQPFWSNGQSAPLFPLHLLFAALPTAWGFLLMPWLRLIIGAVGTRRLALTLGIGPGGALLAGIAFPLSGMVSGYLLFPMANALVMVPWVLWATERVASGTASWRPLAVCVALLALGGHPGTLSHCLLLSAVYLAVRGVRRNGLGALLGGWAVGGALAMVHLLPLALYLPDTARWGDAEDPRTGAGPPWTQVLAMSLRLLQPWAFGRAEDATWRGIFYEPGSRVFVGLLTLLLALVAVQTLWTNRRKTDRRHLAVAALFVFSALVAYRTPYLLGIVESLPIVGRALHHRLLFGVDLGLALMAGVGLDQLRESRTRIWRAAAVLTVGFGVLIAVVTRMGDLRLDTVLPAQWPWLTWLAAASVFLLALGRLKAPRKLLFLLPALLVAAELIVAHAPSAPGLSASHLFPSTPAIEFLQGQTGNTAAVGQVLRPGTSAVYGLRDLRGDDPARPRRFDNKYRQIGSTRTPFFHPVDDWNHEWLDEAGVRWVMTPPNASPPHPSWAVAYDGTDARVFERPEAQPEAWLLGPGRPLEAHRPANNRLRITGLQRGGRVVVSQAWAPGWTAYVGGRVIETMAHDDFLLAADVPPGIDAVEFVYYPPGLVPGATISLVALLALVWTRVPVSLFAPNPRPGTTRIQGEASRKAALPPAM